MLKSPRWRQTRSTVAPTHLHDDQSSILQETMAGARNRERVWRRTLREDRAVVMRIGAAIEGEELLLATLRYHTESGLLCSTPGFSVAISDPETDRDMLTKGPRLSTYQFSTSNGARYELALDNASELFPLESQQLWREVALQEQQRDVEAIDRWRRKTDGLAATGRKEARTHEGEDPMRMIVACELVAVTNCRAMDPIGVEYDLIGCRHGEWAVKNKTTMYSPSCSGRTPLTVPRLLFESDDGTSSIASLGWHDTFHVRRQRDRAKQHESSDTEADGRLYLRFRVYSRDSWGRKRREGYGQLQLATSPGFYDCEVPMWIAVLSVEDRLEELFIGFDEDEQDRYPSDDTDGMSKTMWGATCQSTDMTVRVRLNIAKIGPPPIVDPNTADHLLKSTTKHDANHGNRVVKRSVQEILQSVKLEKRLGGTSALSSQQLHATASSMPTGEVRALNAFLSGGTPPSVV